MALQSHGPTPRDLTWYSTKLKTHDSPSPNRKGERTRTFGEQSCESQFESPAGSQTFWIELSVPVSEQQLRRACRNARRFA